jgi:N utilization substance protein B
MSARHKARKRALDYLYEADIKKVDPSYLLQQRPVEDLSEATYASQLLAGISEKRRKLDEFITTYAEGWDLDRMPVIDRNILRLSLYEALYTDLDPSIALNEALTLAKELSTEESSSYIHGVFSRIAALKDGLVL